MRACVTASDLAHMGMNTILGPRGGRVGQVAWDPDEDYRSLEDELDDDLDEEDDFEDDEFGDPEYDDFDTTEDFDDDEDWDEDDDEDYL